MADVELSLFAPYNDEACVIGDFSDWKDVPMVKGDDGTFRATVELQDGTYNYCFRVRSKSWFLEENAWVTVVDPYATEVRDTAEPCGVLRVVRGKVVLDDYVWEHDDKPLPNDHQLVIYELHVADFSGGEADVYTRGRFEHVTEKLDYLTDLGVNAIELMPIEEFPGDQSWGYNPRHFFAPESSYGPSEDLKRLVDACHARGIRVLKDGVYNHSEAGAPLTQIDHDYWYHHAPRDPEFNWGPEFDYEKFDERLKTYPARRFIGDVLTYWISQFHFDGIRFDAARQLRNFDFLRWVVARAKETAGAKPFYAVAEYIPEAPEVTGQDGPTDSCWHESFYFVLREVMRGEGRDLERLKDHLDPRRRGFQDAANVVNYLSSHDHGHVMADLGDAGIFGAEAFKRVKLGATLLLTAMGTPMIWMGDEFGEYKYKTSDAAKLDWRLLENDENRELHAVFRGLIKLRTSNSALHGSDIAFFHEDAQAGVLGYVRWNGEGSRVVVIVNVSGDYLGGYAVPNFPSDGTWHEWVRNYDADARDGVMMLDLPPYEAKVFVC